MRWTSARERLGCFDVGDLSADQVSWSIRLGPSEHEDDRAVRTFEELAELVPDLLAQCFPPSCGYEAHGVRLSGPLEGVRWTVSRGPFRAEVGLQRYRGRTSPSESSITLRMVASATLYDVISTNAEQLEQLERRVVGWATAGWGLGSVALGILLMSLHGLGPVWAEALLLVPAVAAWRASVSTMIRHALPSGPDRLALPADSVPVADGLRRWRELLPTLQAQYDLLQAAMGQAPFRCPGQLGTADPRVRVRQADGPTLAWRRPALAAIERSQRSASASTRKNDA
jgi:hypothetical protein